MVDRGVPPRVWKVKNFPRPLDTELRPLAFGKPNHFFSPGARGEHQGKHGVVPRLVGADLLGTLYEPRLLPRDETKPCGRVRVHSKPTTLWAHRERRTSPERVAL